MAFCQQQLHLAPYSGTYRKASRCLNLASLCCFNKYFDDDYCVPGSIINAFQL